MMSALASMAGFGPISFAKTEIVWIKLQLKISVNNKIELGLTDTLVTC